jgi:hypothetical protein
MDAAACRSLLLVGPCHSCSDRRTSAKAWRYLVGVVRLDRENMTGL